MTLNQRVEASPEQAAGGAHGLRARPFGRHHVTYKRALHLHQLAMTARLLDCCTAPASDRRSHGGSGGSGSGGGRRRRLGFHLT